MMNENYEWSTPDPVYDILNREFSFGIDVCADFWNKKCETFITKEDNSLEMDWGGFGSVWMNPPYGRELYKFVKKAHEQSKKGLTVVCLLPNNTDSPWFHDFCLDQEIRFIRGRIHFIRKDGKSGRPRFGSIVVIFRPTRSTQ